VTVASVFTDSRVDANRPGSGPFCFSGAAWAASLAPSCVAWVALGANLGDPVLALRQAAAAISCLPWTRCLEASSLYRTRPVDSAGPDYVNAVMAVETCLGPLELLHALQAIELDHGRQRPYRNAPRTLDLDLIWHGGHVRDSLELTLPHPRYAQRAFVIEPLAEVVDALSLSQMGAVGVGNWAPELPEITARLALAQAQGIEKSAEIWLEMGSATHLRP
jgi:2-amino-4-hydroxy-6-hydroxymethyldihydropteridine diphosphokinase